MQATEQVTASRGSVLEVLAVFAKLGITSFGGPIAHLGYFRQEIVVRLGAWPPLSAPIDRV